MITRQLIKIIIATPVIISYDIYYGENNMSFEFTISELKQIKGIYMITPNISSDLRGTIWTSFYKDAIEKLLPEGLSFKHDKFSQSKYNVLRGIHGDYKSWKLVTSVFGEVHQYVVDLRKESPTYLKWEKFIINQNNQISLLLPPRIGNAYYVSSEFAVYHYKYAYKNEYADVNEQFTYAWNDPLLNISWPTQTPILSVRDNK